MKIFPDRVIRDVVRFSDLARSRVLPSNFIYLFYSRVKSLILIRLVPIRQFQSSSIAEKSNKKKRERNRQSAEIETPARLLQKILRSGRIPRLHIYSSLPSEKWTHYFRDISGLRRSNIYFKRKYTIGSGNTPVNLTFELTVKSDIVDLRQLEWLFSSISDGSLQWLTKDIHCER